MLLLVLCEVTFELRKVRCLWCYGTQRKNEDFAICYSWGSYQHRTPESIHWVSMGRKHATPPPHPSNLTCNKFRRTKLWHSQWNLTNW